MRAAALAERSALPGDADIRSANVAGTPSNRRLNQDASGLFASQESVFGPISKEYEAIDARAENLGIQVGGRPVVQAYHDLAGEFGGDQYLNIPEPVRGQLAEIKEAPKNAWQKVRGLQQSIERARRFATDETQRYQLRKLKESVDAILFDPQVEEAVPGLREANAKFREAAATYREGAMRDVLHPNPQRRVPGESAIRRLFRPDKSEGAIADADRLAKAAGVGPTRLRAEVEDAIVAVAMRDQPDLGRFLKSHETVLNRFPNARSRIERVVEFESMAEKAAAAVPAKTEKFPPFRPSKQPKVPALNLVDKPEIPKAEIERSLRTRYVESPRSTIRTLVESPDGLDHLETLARQADSIAGGRDGLRTQGIRYFRDKIGREPTASSIRTVLNERGASLHPLVGSDQLERWVQIADELERLEAMPVPSHSAVPPGPYGKFEEGAVHLGLNALWSPQQKIVRTGELASTLRANMLNEKTRQILETALTRPNKEGLELLRKVRPQNRRPLRRFIVAPGGTAAATAIERNRNEREKRK
jgi:hypothetical protein